MGQTNKSKRRHGSIDAAEVVRRFTEDGTSGMQIAKEFGVLRNAIYRILKAAGVDNKRGWRHYPPSEVRRCSKCERDLPLGAFACSIRTDSRGKRSTRQVPRPYCRECWAKWHRERGFTFTAKTGITLEQYAELLAAQGGVCAICSGTNNAKYRLGIDHDHETGAIRGLLCHRCNTRLKSLEEAEWEVRAKQYLATATTPYRWGDRAHNARAAMKIA